MINFIKPRNFWPAEIIGYLIFSLVIFVLGFWFSSAYQLGDQVLYRDFYSDLDGVSILEIPALQFSYTGSSEPLYGLISWIGADLLSFNKDIYYSIINTILCVSLLRFLLTNSASKFYIVLVFFNYYLFFLLAPAERLKLSILFLMLATLARIHLIKYIFLAGAILSHFQILILLMARSAEFIPQWIANYKLKKSKFRSAAFMLVVFVILANYFISEFYFALLSKFQAYSQGGGLASIVEILLLSFISLIVLRKRYNVILSFLVCALAAYILGSERINIVAFLLFSYHVIVDRRTKHPLVIALMIYFAAKGVIFVSSVYSYGTGF
jgi:hypothetical protein